MNPQQLLKILLGQSAVAAVLLFVLAALLGGAPLLQQMRVMSEEMARQVALAEAAAVASAVRDGRASDDTLNTYRIQRSDLRTRAAQSDPFMLRAQSALERQPDVPFFETIEQGDAGFIRYAFATPSHQLMTLTVPLDVERVRLDRFFGQSYMAMIALALALIGTLVLAGFFVRKQALAFAAQSASAQAQQVVRALSADIVTSSRNLLPWALLLCGLVFAADLTDQVDGMVGIGYMLTVILALMSSRPWHAGVLAFVATSCTFLAPIAAPVDTTWWNYLENHALMVFAIIATAVFGSAYARRSQAEALAQAQVLQARGHSEALRDALTRAEAAEAERSRTLDLIMGANQAAGISIWEWHVTEDVTRIAPGSAVLERLQGQAQYSGFPYADLMVHADDHERWSNAFTQALQARSQSSVTVRYRARSDQPHHMHLHARIVRDESGVATHVVGVDWDVTQEIEASRELERQAQQLRDAERRSERAARSSLEGHWEYDFITREFWASSTYSALTGYTLQELKAQPGHFPGLASEDMLQQHSEALRNHLHHGVPYQVVLHLTRADGEKRWFRVLGAVERDADGKPARIAGSIHDVHEWKLAEDALADVRARFERAIDGAQDGLFEFDYAADHAWTSPRLSEVLGYAPGELGTRVEDIRALVHPEDRDLVRSAADFQIKQQANFDVEHRIRCKNGQWLWMRTRGGGELTADGTVRRVSGSMHDITEARASREAMREASEAAESANRAKSTFLATMSHEIRTPMNGVLGMTGLLLETPLNRVQRDYAETIRASADSLLTILNDILDFSKIEAGKLDIEHIELDLPMNVEDVGGLMAFHAAAKELELIVHVHPEVPERVFGDPQRIRQCLLNLVGNAIKFTERGEVVIDVCTVGTQNGRHLVHFEVRDTGAGIAPEALAELFQPFTQADSSTTRKFGGTGLGLSIVRRLVELMGGQCGVQSEPERGSTFWFTLPLEPVLATAGEAPVAHDHGRRILLIDDNRTNRHVLTEQLKRAGYEVVSAAGADSALTLLTRASGEPFDLVLLDYQMPELDGVMLGERIVSDCQQGTNGGHRPHLVLLTSMDRSGELQRLSDIGFAAYLTKPVRSRDLIACLTQVFARAGDDWHLRSQPLITRSTLLAQERQAQYDGRVLLVEDNKINQRVGQKFLERLGCSVDVAEDGAQALAAVRAQSYGLILMDMQMPVMDGIEATRLIRELEAGGRRTPIVALTANAMMGQLERCLEAGMDNYLTKPLDIARLQDVLDTYFGGSSQAMTHIERTLTAPATHLGDVRRRLQEVSGGDAEFERELITAFVDSGEETLREMHTVLERGDRAGLSRCAHRFKGACANLHIDFLTSLAQAIETGAKAGAAHDWKADVAQLAAEFKQVCAALRSGPAAQTAGAARVAQ
ncbi:MAG: response regulator [Steroidobacteraceae bacterium]